MSLQLPGMQIADCRLQALRCEMQLSLRCLSETNGKILTMENILYYIQ